MGLMDYISRDAPLFEAMRWLSERQGGNNAIARALTKGDEAVKYAVGPQGYQALSGAASVGNLMSPAADLQDLQGAAQMAAQPGWEPKAKGAALAGAGLMGLFMPGSAGAVARAADDGGAGTVKAAQGIRAYHGSPHDFDKFSMDKIGTGEGAQAYGHGLYFAENENVARQYRDELTRNIDAGGVRIQQGNRVVGTTGDSSLDDYIVAFEGDMDRVVRELEGEVAEMYPNAADRRGVREMLEKARELRDSGAVKTSSAGRMYEVNINADPDDFLDWDKPLSVDEVERLANRVDRANPTLARELTDWASRAEESGAKIRGEDIVREFGYREGLGYGNPGLAQIFRDAGIPGIRYLDQGSRAAKEGTRNFVVFDDSTIEILRKYGLAGLIAGGVAGAGSSEQSPTVPPAAF